MINGEMKRRTFLSGLLSILPAASFASGLNFSKNADTELMHRVVESFPKTRLNEAYLHMPMHMTFFLVMYYQGNWGLKLTNDAVDITQEYTLDKIFHDDLLEMKFEDRWPEVPKVVSSGNKIAVKTRRGKGNRYAVFSDHVLVWYEGNNPYDNAVQKAGKNLVYNPNYKDYFVRVRDVVLTEEDHANLAYNRFKRIV